MRVTVVVSLVLAASVARAETREELQGRGEERAKEGRYAEAIAAFKAADRIEERASHACLIALAYTRREMWPQAELFLALCHGRKKAGEVLPDWVPLADEQIRQRLSEASVSPVTIAVLPAGTPTTLTVSSFAPDEVFEPRTIYLPPGTHVIIARSKGYPDAQHVLELGYGDRSPQTVVIDVSKPPPRAPAPPASKVPFFFIGGGGMLIGGGVVAHIVYYAPRRRALDAAPTGSEYDALEGAYDRARRVTVGLYALGGALAIAGVVLQLRGSRAERPTVTLVATQGGGMVSVGWRR
jgi:hypothetical protein